MERDRDRVLFSLSQVGVRTFWKGPGPCEMSQAPKAARLGLLGFSAGSRVPLKTSEQKGQAALLKIQRDFQDVGLPCPEGARRGVDVGAQQVLLLRSEEGGQGGGEAWKGAELAWAPEMKGVSPPGGHLGTQPPPQHSWVRRGRAQSR